jgi:hypothetical protein
MTTVDSSIAIHASVPIHAGVSLAVEQDDSGLLATVILTKAGNKLSQVYRSPLADALARAKNVSSDSGFEGYYDITGVDDLPTIKPEGLGGVLREIDRQSNELQPKTGFHWGATPQWTPNELAAMPAAQAHSARLARLRDALVKRVGMPQSR